MIQSRPRGSVTHANHVDVNYQYFVQLIKRLPASDTIRVLDFGCGRGEVVGLLRCEGIDCYGADVCIEGTSYPELYESELFKKGIIRAIREGGVIPFDADYFDVIISNQVFEHIPDKDVVLSGLDRVLRNDGFMYHHFPSREVVREGHIGVPFVHWLPQGRIRFCYTLVLRHLGFGYFKNQGTPKEWVRARLDWLDKYCFYEAYRNLHAMFRKRYVVSHREFEYCVFRARGRRLIQFLLRFPFLKGFYGRVFRRFGFMAIELRKHRPN